MGGVIGRPVKVFAFESIETMESRFKSQPVQLFALCPWGKALNWFSRCQDNVTVRHKKCCSYGLCVALVNYLAVKSEKTPSLKGTINPKQTKKTNVDNVTLDTVRGGQESPAEDQAR